MVPTNIAREVRQRVYGLADEGNYLGTGRVESGKFMNQLVVDSGVGVVLVGYMKRERVRTYIKDTILNRYSKKKMREEKPSDFTPIIRDQYGIECELLEEYKKDIFLYKKVGGHPNKTYVVVAGGTYTKWESALRKALLRIGGYPAAGDDDSEFIILLSLFASHSRINNGDKKLLKVALGYCGAIAFIYGEGS